MTIPDRELEFSPLGGPIHRDGYMVRVLIYRFADTGGDWTLEVVDQEGGSTLWTEQFRNDLEAYEAFEQVVAEDGIASFAKGEHTGH